MGKRGPKPQFINVACPNKDCKLYGLTNQGNVVGNGTYISRGEKTRRYLCRHCGKVFNDHTGTFYHDLRKDEQTIDLALKMSMKGMSIEAIADVLEIQPASVKRWLARSAEQCDKVNDNMMKNLEVPKIEMDEQLLNEKGILSIEELDQRKRQVAERLVKKFVDSGLGLMYQDPEFDKYTFDKEADVDCESRLDVCKAICCKLPFALSKQDVEEGIICWEFGRPYLIAHEDDGYCVHLDRKTYKCKVRKHRTVPCRGFNCRNNEQWHVWEDYAKKIFNSGFEEQTDRDNTKIYSCCISNRFK